MVAEPIGDEEGLETKVRKKIKQLYKLHDSVVKVERVKNIPVTQSGKRDYKTMTNMK